MTLNDFDVMFELSALSLLPKNWLDDLTVTQSLGHSVVKLIRAKNSIAVQQNGKKAGHIGYAVQMYIKDIAAPEGKRIVKSATVYVDFNGKLLQI